MSMRKNTVILGGQKVQIEKIGKFWGLQDSFHFQKITATLIKKKILKIRKYLPSTVLQRIIAKQKI